MFISIGPGKSFFSTLIFLLALFCSLSGGVQALDKKQLPVEKIKKARRTGSNSIEMDQLSEPRGKENEPMISVPENQKGALFSDSMGPGLEPLESLDVVIVNTLDGCLHGMAKTDGRLLWTTKSTFLESEEGPSMVRVVKYSKRKKGPSSNDPPKGSGSEMSQISKDIIVSTNSDVHSDVNGQAHAKSVLPLSNAVDDIIFIPEPAGSGDLYYMTRSSTSSMSELQKFNISLRDIVENHLGVREGSFIFTGGKSTTVIAIDPITGAVLRSFGSSIQQQCVEAAQSNQKQKCGTYDSISNAVFISKTRYQLEIHSVLDNKVLWNISYYELKPASSSSILDSKHVSSTFAADTQGNFKLLKDTNQFMFQTEFNAPVLNVFDVVPGSNENHLISIAPQDTSDNPEQKGYIGNHEGTLYLLSDKHFPFMQKSIDKSVEHVEECFDTSDNERKRAKCLIGTYSLEKKQKTLPPSSYAPELSHITNLKFLLDRLVIHASKVGTKLAVLPVVIGLLFYSIWKGGIKFLESIFSLLYGWKKLSTVVEIQDKAIESSLEANSIPEQIILDDKQAPASSNYQAFTNAEESEKNSNNSHSLSKNPESSLLPSTSNSGLKVLSVSEKILGYGSHGTIVLQGTFEGRPVAIKRMLSDFYDVADHEVKILQQSDEHHNVVRYYFKEECDGFMYVALEKCAGTLADLVEGKDVPELNILRSHVSLKEMISQIVSGIAHLHSLNIAHRDIKPQNILVSSLKTDKLLSKKNRSPRLLISDFGLGKRLDDGQSSFHNTFVAGGHVAGTIGWRAPETLMAHKLASENITTSNTGKSNDFDEISGRSSRADNDIGSSNDTNGHTNNLERHKSNHVLRITKAIDIFSAGCVFYYLLTNGSHPFGDKLYREINIVKGNYRFNHKEIGKESDCSLLKLIQRMISRDPQKRPSAESVKRHPYFWSASKQLMFLQDLSDRLEKECRDPPSSLLKVLERQANKIIGRDWLSKVNRTLLEDVQKFRKYEGSSLQDLLRVIRNKKHHYQELTPALKKEVGALPDGFLEYFASRFPNLVVSMVTLVENNRNLFDDTMLDQYFIKNADQL